jgi:hypothetical protein
MGWINPEKDTISLILLLGILIFKGFTARRLYKSFGVKGLHSLTQLFLYESYMFQSKH